MQSSNEKSRSGEAANFDKSKLPESRKRSEDEVYGVVLNGLKNAYKKAIRPVEEAYKFDCFYSPCLEDVDIEANSMILLMGSYSSGKTSFIRYLIGRDFPGIRIGPEPTTDRFVCVMHGSKDQIIPGNALCVASDRPFRALGKFGGKFLNRIEGSLCNSDFLESITLIDTPGVLAGEKQRVGREYNFTEVIEWFAERSDRILLLFDAHKLDISDEFKRSIEVLRGHDEKVRVVLNKADSISAKQLMRVYGALMWSLGKVVNTPEVLRVYVGSFWDQGIKTDHENYNLFKSEAEDLLGDLRSLPRNSAIRKINELVKRARLARVHAYIISHLRSQLPHLWGATKKQRELLEKLPEEFNKIATKHKISPGDFPNVNRFREIMSSLDLGKIPKLKEKAISNLDKALQVTIPELMDQLRETSTPENLDILPEKDSNQEEKNPFLGLEPNTKLFSNTNWGTTLESNAPRWIISQSEKTASDNLFFKSPLSDTGRLGGDAARSLFSKWGLSNETMFEIWKLASLNNSGELDSDEFAVAMHLLNKARAGEPLPSTLPSELIPPSKRSVC